MRYEQPGSRFLALSLLTVLKGATPADANQVRPPLTNLGNALLHFPGVPQGSPEENETVAEEFKL